MGLELQNNDILKTALIEAQIQHRQLNDEISKLREINNLLSNLPSSINYFELSRTGQGLYSVSNISPLAMELLELQKDTLSQEEFFALIYKDDLHNLLGNLVESSRELTPLDIELRIESNTGNILWVRIMAKPTLNKENTTIWHGMLVDISRRVNIQSELEKRISFERLALDVSAAFLDMSVDDFDQGIENALKSIAEYVSADSGYYITINHEQQTFSMTHLWKNYKLNSSKENLSDISLDKTKWWHEKISRGETIILRSLDDIPEDAYFERNTIAVQNINSGINVPVFYKDELVGVIGLSSSSTNPNWGDMEVMLLRLLGNIILRATRIKESEIAYRTTQNLYKILYESSQDGIFILRDGVIIDANQHTLEMFGVSKEKFIGLEPQSFSPRYQPDGILSSKKGAEKIAEARTTGSALFEWLHARPNGEEFYCEVSIVSVNFDEQMHMFVFLKDITRRKRIENELYSNRELLHAVIQAIPLPLFAKRVDDFTYMFVNQAFLDYFGFGDESEILGKTGYDIWDNKDALTYNNMDLDALKTGTIKTIEKKLHVNGSERSALISKSLFKDVNGTVTGILGTLTDITEIREALNAKQLSEENFEKIFLISPLEMSILRISDNTYVEVNDTYCKNSGYTRDEVVGKKFDEFSRGLSEENKEIIAQKLEKYDRVDNMEITLTKKNGEMAIGLLYINKIKVEGEHCFLTIFNDITERKKKEIQLIESELKYRTLVENINEVIVSIDKHGTITYISQAVQKLLGLSPQQVLGKQFSSLVYREDQEFVQSKFDDSDSGMRKDEEFRLVEMSGEARWVRASMQPVLEKGQFRGITGVISDINDRKVAENELQTLNMELEERVIERTAQLEEAMEELQFEIEERKRIAEELIKYQKELAKSLENEKELNKLKTRFISMVSHEYRTPLTIILSSAELLDKFFKSGEEDKHTKYLERIKTSVKSMINLLEDVLYIGREDSIDTLSDLEDLDVIEIMKIMIDEANAVDKFDHDIEFIHPEEKVYINSNKTALNHIVSNLISNALKYSFSNTKVTVEIVAGSSLVEMKFIDQGIGMAEEDLKNVFNHFYRGSNVGTISGTGLGLAIVKRNVDLMKGQIFVRSELNKGTEFIVHLPRSK